jgi:hypothetical protein
MKAKEILSKIADIVGVELASMGSKVYAKLEDGSLVSSNAFENGNVVLVGDGNSSLADGEYEVYVDGEAGAKLYKLVIEKGLISQFELLPKKGEQKMSEQTKNTNEQVKLEEVDEVKEPVNPMDEEKKEQEKMSVEDSIASIEARIKVLEEYLKADKADEKDEDEMMGKNKEEKMSKAKKFNGAPVEEAKAKPIVNQTKSSNTIDKVWERMAAFK